MQPVVVRTMVTPVKNRIRFIAVDAMRWAGVSRRGGKPHGVGELRNGHADGAIDDSLSDGVAGKAGDVMDGEFAHEMLPVLVHRLEAHAQFRGNLLVGLALGNEL